MLSQHFGHVVFSQLNFCSKVSLVQLDLCSVNLSPIFLLLFLRGFSKLGNRYNGNLYNGINYNGKVESDITESGITESVITLKFESGIGYNRKMESTITESGTMESDITKKRNHA